MDNNYDILLNNLKSGFIDKDNYSKGKYSPELIYNNRDEDKKVLTTLINELENCKEFWFSVAFITNAGVSILINALRELEEKGVKGKILTSQYLNFTQPIALERIKALTNIELKISTSGNFHSKGYLFKTKDTYNLMIGSSNLTDSALSTNKEWNLKISATENSSIGIQVIREFEREFELGVDVTSSYLKKYKLIWNEKFKHENKLKYLLKESKNITPNEMQTKALVSIEKLRNEGQKKALLISATGTGKTYLSAFDVKRVKPKRFLFVVHRKTIAQKALETFRNLLGTKITMGLYSGSDKNKNVDYVFCTVQTLSRDSHLHQFKKDHFDYIVIDETHRAAASSYRNIMDYFTPDFILGMTATPERTDGENIYELFDYNIAYKIRLHDALEHGMIAPFHYYGVTDLTVDGTLVENKMSFNKLTHNDRVNHIIDEIQFYGCDDGNIKGLVFCSSNEVSKQLSKAFNERKYRTLALTADSSPNERSYAIKALEAGNLDYIFTRDIFNEGIDIPSVNQIVMLRPTQSAIVFVQQLGRGLRKTNTKEYLTVIDFIGNYDRNYLIPIALYGDSSYNKDKLRRLISKGSALMPGTSTVNFDRISKEKIFEAISSSNMRLKKDLDESYRLLKFELGRIPKMIDFLNNDSRDPFHFVKYSKSYYNYVCKIERLKNEELSDKELKLLELFALEINNAKRIEESLMLMELIVHESFNVSSFKKKILSEYQYEVSDQTIDSCILNLNFKFTREKFNGKQIAPNDKYDVSIVRRNKNIIERTPYLNRILQIEIFKDYLLDNANYAIEVYNKIYKRRNYFEGFNLYQKYSRKDVFRILNTKENPIAQNVGGYMITGDKSSCPIFVNYQKEDHISSATKYEDRFIDPITFEWMSKNKRYLKSPDVKAIKDHKSSGLRLPLFIKKNNDEGMEFYYMGELETLDDSFVEAKIADDNNKMVSVVKVRFKLNPPVADDLYKYIVQ